MTTTALLLTQYERFETIGKDEYIENYINEELEVTADMICDYNEYLSENGYECYYDDLEMMLKGMTAMEVVRATHFGDFRYNDDYFQFNGYGNVDSFTDYQIVNMMKKDKDFLLWYIEENDLIDFEDEDVLGVIQEANDLLAAGY